MKRFCFFATVLAIFCGFALFASGASAADAPAAPAEEPKAAPKEEPAPAPAEEDPKAAPAKEEPKAAPAAEEAEPPVELAWPWAKKAQVEVHGEVTERYRIRDTEGESDQDFEGILDLEVGNLFDGKVDLLLHMGAFWDTWGRQDSKNAPESFYFSDVFDTYETKVQGRVYTLAAEVEDVVDGLDLVLGRQMVHKGRHLHFDGLRLGYSPSPVFELTLAGGLPVYFSEAEALSNFVAAGYLEVYPGFALDGYPDRATKITFEFIHVHEGGPALDDDYISLQLWQRLFGGAALVYLQGGFLNGKTRDFQAALTAHCPFTGVEAKFRFLSSPSIWGDVEDGETEELTIDMSPFLGVMGLANPYSQFDLALYKQFCPYFGAELLYAGRTPTKGEYESAYNHDFDKVSATAFFYDPFKVGLDASVSGEFWYSDGPNEDDNNLTWGFDLTWRPSDTVRLTAGSHFLKYRVVYEPDQFTRISEKSDVRLLSLGLEIRPCPRLRLGARYMLESDEGWHDRSFDTLEVRAGFQF